MTASANLLNCKFVNILDCVTVCILRNTLKTLDGADYRNYSRAPVDCRVKTMGSNAEVFKFWKSLQRTLESTIQDEPSTFDLSQFNPRPFTAVPGNTRPNIFTRISHRLQSLSARSRITPDP